MRGTKEFVVIDHATSIVTYLLPLCGRGGRSSQILAAGAVEPTLAVLGDLQPPSQASR